ncbi:MAG: hypothetical protein B6D39_04575 [Anaerolineae bacterium UTCFX2]|nr:MAG: hypothetical protein B6D39_04575 [Anaerolineae bacterium UTCFX2]
MIEAALLSAWLSSAFSPGGVAADVVPPTAQPNQVSDVQFTAATNDVLQAVYLLLLEDDDNQVYLPRIGR